LFPAVDEAARVSFVYRMRLEHLVDEVPCTACQGARLRPDAAATRFANHTLGDLCAKPLAETLKSFQDLKMSKEHRRVAGEVLREVTNRLTFLVDVGLDYLTLARSGPTLSGGEAQRIRLASQIGSGLTGVLYVLDEPTIGLHPRDNTRLLAALHRLRDLGNTMVLVEHDREVIQAADYLLDFGPGAGDRGGEITAAGPPKQVLKSKASLTGQYLAGALAIPVPTNRRILGEPGALATGVQPDAKTSPRARKAIASGSTPVANAPGSPRNPESSESVAALAPSGKVLSVLGARQHNLRNVDVHFPLGAVIAVTGVSGSGKSSLVNEVLYNTLARKLNRARTAGAAHDEIKGLEHIDKVIAVDQDPIGNSPSSNPATYTGVFDLVRELYARMPEAKVRGYHPRRFSFNQKGGRCEACEGMGQKKIEMHFLPDVWVECDVCHGSRYNPETLAVKYKDKSIADVLNMRVTEALEIFGNIPKVRTVLQTLDDVGLGYMAMGQAAPTMSGGEAQRVKLAGELARPSTGKTLYILDEPTTGLHFDDVKKLLAVLHRLADLGNTVIVVEHNLDVIKTSDWVIDVGPEAGLGGGRIVAAGTPEIVAEVAESHTGRYLKEVLAAGPHAEREVYDPKAALAKRLGDMDIAQVGKDQKLPWEADGKTWHLKTRVTTKGQPVKWDGEAVASVISQVEEVGGFSETNWNHRSVIEVAAETKSHGWFLHAMTGHEGYLKFVFRVPRNTFKQDKLADLLSLKPLSDYAGHEGYAREKRVEVANPRGVWQMVVVTIAKGPEVETAGFRLFLRQAADAFRKAVGAMDKPEGIEAVMPWKVNGEKWHLSEKGFPAGRPVKWDRGILPQLIQLVKEVDAKLEVKWDTRDAIVFKDGGRYWARWKTKERDVLECRFFGKPGAVNLAAASEFGKDPELLTRPDGHDELRLAFVTADQIKPAKLKAFLAGHLKAFRTMVS
jgi:excinuclease ABC subunit A